MLQSSFSSIAQLRDRIEGLRLLFGIEHADLWLHDIEGGHTDSNNEAVFFGGGLRKITHVGYLYITVDLSDGNHAKIKINENQSKMYWVSFDY